MKPFPTECPHCRAHARYEHHKTFVDGVHVYGLTTWECGYGFQRYLDEVSEKPVEIVTGECRRVPHGFRDRS